MIKPAVTQTVVYEPEVREWWIVTHRERDIKGTLSSYHLDYRSAIQEAKTLYIVPGMSSVQVIHVGVRDE